MCVFFSIKMFVPHAHTHTHTGTKHSLGRNSGCSCGCDCAFTLHFTCASRRRWQRRHKKRSSGSSHKKYHTTTTTTATTIWSNNNGHYSIFSYDANTTLTAEPPVLLLSLSLSPSLPLQLVHFSDQFKSAVR